MSEVKWTFLSNHGRVFRYLARHPKNTIEGLAQDAGLSIAGVHRIIDDLEECGYVVRHKIGRSNQYILHPELPMRHHLEWDCTAADILLPIGNIQLVKKSTPGEGHVPTTGKPGHVSKTPVASV